MNCTLYRHKNNTDVAAQVLSFRPIPGKNYARVEVMWWNIGPHEPFCLNISTKLTDATIKGNKREREKYPLDKWMNDWIIYERDQP